MLALGSVVHVRHWTALGAWTREQICRRQADSNERLISPLHDVRPSVTVCKLKGQLAVQFCMHTRSEIFFEASVFLVF